MELRGGLTTLANALAQEEIEMRKFYADRQNTLNVIIHSTIINYYHLLFFLSLTVSRYRHGSQQRSVKENDKSC
jgi:hypothetical protein